MWSSVLGGGLNLWALGGAFKFQSLSLGVNATVLLFLKKPPSGLGTVMVLNFCP